MQSLEVKTENIFTAKILASLQRFIHLELEYGMLFCMNARLGLKLRAQKNGLGHWSCAFFKN